MNALSSLSQGWFGGYMFSRANATEAEYRQGANPYIVVGPQTLQAIYCETALRPLTQLGFRSGIAKVISVCCSFGLVVFPFLAASYIQDQPVKEGASFLRKATHFTAACFHKYAGKALFVALAAAAVALTEPQREPGGRTERGGHRPDLAGPGLAGPGLAGTVTDGAGEELLRCLPGHLHNRAALHGGGAVGASFRPDRRPEGCQIDVPKRHPLHPIEPIRSLLPARHEGRAAVRATVV